LEKKKNKVVVVVVVVVVVGDPHGRSGQVQKISLPNRDSILGPSSL
jgi:hypothetical protein